MYIVKCVGIMAEDKKMSWIIKKTNSGRSFQCTKFSVIDFVHTDRRNFSGTRQKSADLPTVDFRSQQPSKKIWTSLPISFMDFSVF